MEETSLDLNGKRVKALGMDGCMRGDSSMKVGK